MCNACQILDQLNLTPCGHTGDARVTVSNPVWNAGKTRTVSFYRSTRPQAPKYAKLPENVDRIECSICRGLFLDDTPEARKAHRQAHLEGHWTAVCPLCDEDVCNHLDCLEAHGKVCAQFVEARDTHTC